jgi:hypothetical protein
MRAYVCMYVCQHTHTHIPGRTQATKGQKVQLAQHIRPAATQALAENTPGSLMMTENAHASAPISAVTQNMAPHLAAMDSSAQLPAILPPPQMPALLAPAQLPPMLPSMQQQQQPSTQLPSSQLPYAQLSSTQQLPTTDLTSADPQVL